MTVFILVVMLFKFIFVLIFGYLRASCCMQAFSSCGEHKLFSIAVHEHLNAVASLVVEYRLQACGLK